MGNYLELELKIWLRELVRELMKMIKKKNQLILLYGRKQMKEFNLIVLGLKGVQGGIQNALL